MKKSRGKKKGQNPKKSEQSRKFIFAHLLGQGQVLLDVEKAAQHFQERDYAKFAHFNGEKIGPTFLPEVFINYCPKIVQDFDEAFENVMEILEPLEAEQKDAISEIQNILLENIEDSKNVINESLEMLEAIKESDDPKLDKFQAVLEIEKRLKAEADIFIPGGFLDNEDAKARGEEIWNLRNYKLPEIERAKSDFVEKEVMD
jgi:predicted phage tail protein